MSTDNESVAIQVRVAGSLRDDVEDWRKRQERVPPLSQALRQLLQLALSAERHRKPIQPETTTTV